VTLVAQGAGLALAEATAITRENRQAAAVFISGATGVNAWCINGYFEPTQEKGPDGRLILTKRGDANILLEHFAGRWNVKSRVILEASKCKAGTFAYIPGGCALVGSYPHSTPFQFKVYDGKNFIDAPGVKMETGPEARQKVSGCCLRAHQHALLPPVGASIASCDACCAVFRVCRR
jgi:hypothetical protein